MNSESEGHKIHEFVAHSTEVNCLTIGPLSNQVIATGGEDCKVNLWRVDNATNIWSLGQNKSPIESLCFDNDEQYIVSGALNGSLKIFDLNEGKLARTLLGHQVNTCSIHYHPFGEFIVSGSLDTTMKVWDVRNKSCIQTYTGHEKEITCVRFSPDGRWVASAGKDGQLFMWDLIAGKLLSTIRVQPSLSYITTFEFNPSEFLLAAVTSVRSVRLWDLETMESIGHTPPDNNPIRAMCFANEAYLCAATCDAVKVYSWDPVTLRASSSMPWDKVADIKVGKDNQLVACSCNSNFVSIFAADLDAIIAAGVDSKEEEKRDAKIHRPSKNPSKRESVIAEPKTEDEKQNVLCVQGHGHAKAQPISQDKRQSPSQNIGQQDSVQRAVPGVLWSEGVSSTDMETSMGASIAARMKAVDDKSEVPANLAQMLPAGRFPPSAGIAGSAVGGGFVPSRARKPSTNPPPHRVSSPIARQQSPLPRKDRDEAAGRGGPVMPPRDRDRDRDHDEAKGMGDVDSVEDLLGDQVDRLVGSSVLVTTALQQRLTSLRMLKRLWERGDIEDVVAELGNLHEGFPLDPRQMVVIVHFLNAVDLHGSGVSLDICGQLLPILCTLLGQDAAMQEEFMVSTALRCVATLCDSFGDLIRQTRNVGSVGAVDLSREERLTKCNRCHSLFGRIRDGLDNVKWKHRGNGAVLELTAQTAQVLAEFL